MEIAQREIYNMRVAGIQQNKKGSMLIFYRDHFI